MLVYQKNPYSDQYRNRTMQNNRTFPATNVMENNDDFMLEMALPGYEKNEIVIDIEQNELKISSKKTDPSQEDRKMLRQEFSKGAFERIFELPDTVDAENIEATFKNGLLSISIPKHDFARVKPAREISIA